MPGMRQSIDPKTLRAASRLCGVVANDLRRAILWSLTDQPRDVTFLADQHEKSISLVSNNLKLLLDLGLVRFEKVSRRRIYSLTEKVRAIRHKKARMLRLTTDEGVQLLISEPRMQPESRSTPGARRRSKR